jgi:hypothetical protein
MRKRINTETLMALAYETGAVIEIDPDSDMAYITVDGREHSASLEPAMRRHR